jgi:integrase
MQDTIKVHVVKYPDRDNLVLRYLDPLTNKHVTRSARTTRQSEAVKAAGKWEAELREGRYKALCRMTWAEFREKYEAEVLPGLADGTGECKATVMNHLERAVTPQRVADLTTSRLSAFVAKLRADGMKDTTLAGQVAHLKPILKWAVKQGYLRTMPDIEKPKRAKGVNRAMRGRPVTGEELDRMLDKVKDERKREPEKWKQLIRGLYLSGLRLGEALALSWDGDTPIAVDVSGKYPALRIRAEAEKAHRDRLLPIAPEFAEFLLAVPPRDRHGLVFGIEGPGGPLSTKRASRYLSAIGKAAKVVIDKAADRYATAHDLRRSFGSRWAPRVTPAVLRDLMRHSSITTTMSYYVDLNAENVGDVLRSALGNKSGNNAGSAAATVDIEVDGKGVTIRG